MDSGAVTRPCNLPDTVGLGDPTMRIADHDRCCDGGAAAPNDGGAADSAVPQTILGMVESENVTSPPVRMNDSGRNV
ncbi:hypothetical protein BZL29_6880 [Mycobacterium kansasii]|uniref:Uncharacterized protein n=1 Tax=Mycobacterium kansasii TaxID=1768 RepID=A0A1V3WNE0_MYCKA|nr:hypothetical protein BZL29_6880 [Mycobacterium kansasii]